MLVFVTLMTACLSEDVCSCIYGHKNSAEMQELEYWKTKFDIAGAATEGYFSRRWVSENLLGLSQDEPMAQVFGYRAIVGPPVAP